MAAKPKTPQPETPNDAQKRDLFQTPAYAVDMLAPYIHERNIWEPAAGEGRLARRLRHHRHSVVETDLRGTPSINFLNGAMPHPEIRAIVTNPPFSLKGKFAQRCLEHRLPWALLIPADPAGWLLDLIDGHGCQLLIPKRRIDYITPDILQNVSDGETLAAIIANGDSETVVVARRLAQMTRGQKAKLKLSNFPPEVVGRYRTARYESVDDVPPELLAKYSASQFHSCWLTWGLNLPNRMTIVELTKKDKLNI